MRLATAIAVVALAWSAALYVHQRRVSFHYKATCASNGNSFYNTPCTGIGFSQPSWEDPLAVLTAIGGLAVAVGIAYRPRRTS